MKNIRFLVISALLIALTCISTMIIRIPTPGFGYIHPGDGFVLLSGLLLGPIAGPLCAGLGSAMADLFSGYLIYVPGTFVIKALCSLIAYALAFGLMKLTKKEKSGYTRFGIPAVIVASIIGELFMVAGYYIYESFIIGFEVGSVAALASVPFNLVQGTFGVIIASVLYPLILPLYKRVVASGNNVA